MANLQLFTPPAAASVFAQYVLVDGTRAMTGRLTAPSATLTANGAASTPALQLTGTPYTAGDGTTNKPLLMLQPTGTVSTGWSTGGTMLGVNAPSGFTGNLFDAQLNGVSGFAVAYTGAITNTVLSGSIGFKMVNPTGAIYASLGIAGVNGYLALGRTDGSLAQIYHQFGSAGGFGFTDSIAMYSTGQIQWSSLGSFTSGSIDTTLARVAAGVIGTAAMSITGNGAASLPALSLTGIPFAGTGTTSFPLLYLNNSGATASTTLSTAGTAFGINSHGTPDLMNLMVDGVSKFWVSSVGQLLMVSGSASAPTLAAIGTPGFGAYFPGTTEFAIASSSVPFVNFYGGGPSVLLASGLDISWVSTTNTHTGSGDTSLRRSAAGIVGLGTCLQIPEMTAPAAPATNNVRFYAEDNGAGKTRLMALFPTGAAQQVAIEP